MEYQPNLQIINEFGQIMFGKVQEKFTVDERKEAMQSSFKRKEPLVSRNKNKK